MFLPSTAIAWKLASIPGIIAYLFVASLALYIGKKYFFSWFLSFINEYRALVLLLLTFFVVSILFFIAYPIVNRGVITPGGGDLDEALQIGVTELLHGRYPYYQLTYLGNWLGPLPGAIILAAPFVLLGNSAYANIFWLAVFVLVVKRYLNSTPMTLLLLWIILVLSPEVLHMIVSGSDHLSNSLYVQIFALWLVSSVPRTEVRMANNILPAILLGIGLSSRSNFVFLLPLVFSALFQKCGLRAAMKYIGIVCASYVVITLPFYLYDPDSFTPLNTARKLNLFETVVPFAGIIIPIIMALLAILLSFQRVNHLDLLCRNCAIVQAFPVVCGVILSSMAFEEVDFSYAFYGSFFMFFGAFAYWQRVVENQESFVKATPQSIPVKVNHFPDSRPL